MIITDFFIYDSQKERGAHFSFSPKANIIISNDSKVGKSCLLKSLFYTLGLDIKNSFAQGWHPDELLFKVKYQHNGQSGYIVRSKNVFYVNGKQDILDEKGFATWLVALLGLNIKLPLKKIDAMHIPYASAILAPFYIDQDSSWKGTPYKNTVSSLQMYTPGSFPQKVFEGLFGISNDTLIELEEKRTKLLAEKKEIDNQLKVLMDLRNSFVKQSIQNPFLNIKNLENNIKLWISETESLRKEIDKEKNNIYSIQQTINHYEMDKEEMEKLLRETDRMFNSIEYKCTLCHSILTKEQSQQRLKLSGNKYSILQYLSDYKQKILNKRNELQEHFTNLNVLTRQYEDISKKLQKEKEWLNVKNIVEANAQHLLNEKYLTIAQNLRLSINTYQTKIKLIDDEIKQIKKETLNLRKEIESSFKIMISSLSDFFTDVKINSIEFLKFTLLSDSGTRLNELFFSIYMTYFHLLIKYAKIKFVLGLDSPITTEPSENNLPKIYTLIEQYLLKSDVQTIVVMLSDKLKFLSSRYHLIDLKKPILSNKNIEHIRSEFNCIFPTKSQ